MIKHRFLLATILFSVIVLSSMKTADDWTLYKTKDGVSIYTKIESRTYNGKVTNYQIFKYKNSNKYSVSLSWKLNVWYNGVCRACDLPSPNEYEMKLELNAGEVKTGNAKSESKIFSVFQSSEGISPLDKFEFENLKITPKE